MVRHDAVLQRLFGFVRMTNFKALIRFFNQFSQATSEHVFGQLYRWLFEQSAMACLTVDLDSTVLTRYGVQEGAAKCYNPRRKGRLSHHPLMAFVADLRLIANCWLRPPLTWLKNCRWLSVMNTVRLLGERVISLFCDRKTSIFRPFLGRNGNILAEIGRLSGQPHKRPQGEGKTARHQAMR
jgi:hypothetical protein